LPQLSNCKITTKFKSVQHFDAFLTKN